jgi:hypothetical protein
MPPEQIADLKRQYASGMIDLKKKAEELKIDNPSLAMLLDSFNTGAAKATQASGCATARMRPSPAATGSTQLVEHRPCLFEIGGVEALGEPAIDGRQQVVRLCAAALVVPQPGKARGDAQFPELGLLLLGDA